MVIGVPKEIKEAENRVAIIPAGVKAMRAHGHRVLVQRGAGDGSGLPDEAYVKAGAELVGDPSAIYGEAISSIRSRNLSIPSARCFGKDRYCSPSCIWPPCLN